jgi:hypothetical protein
MVRAVAVPVEAIAEETAVARGVVEVPMSGEEIVPARLGVENDHAVSAVQLDAQHDFAVGVIALDGRADMVSHCLKRGESGYAAFGIEEGF